MEVITVAPRAWTLALVILLCAVARSDAQRGDPAFSLQAFLATGKAAGGCGILNLQLQFQSNTVMAGGDEFIVRFWTTEAARLGMTLQQYAAEHCKTSLSTYDRLMMLAEEIDAQK